MLSVGVRAKLKSKLANTGSEFAEGVDCTGNAEKSKEKSNPGDAAPGDGDSPKGSEKASGSSGESDVGVSVSSAVGVC